MQDSVFTKIIKGEIPSHKLYEDGRTIAILDIHPIVEGHSLVIPKKQVEALWDLDDEDYQSVMYTAKTVAKQLREVLGVPYVGIKLVGLDVPHAHIHLIPFTTSEEFNRTEKDASEPDQAVLAALAMRLMLHV